MTDSVDKLIRLSLNSIIKTPPPPPSSKNSFASAFSANISALQCLSSSAATSTAPELSTSSAQQHRVRVRFGLLNLKAAELHGSLLQVQRVKSVELFRLLTFSSLRTLPLVV
ncbi:hypothetical protein L211DRAFT_845211 [Terfezia boudieri ATCC MYA-4762]|uniref:Uncharacterized protein n=1 Tax=Terfezia boudieri ATCC MYA-4762 TaxID=1051890 RepID=A0A3N4M5T1_9PEZI|nr:hypothetical protein L211DRAFT_845211 [Terfezia boudieri ATCC MYA-4762]